MQILNSAIHLNKFNNSFGKSYIGIRELRYIVALLEINCDTYKNSEENIKTIIGLKLNQFTNSKKIENVKNYLTISKVEYESFNFIEENKFFDRIIDLESQKIIKEYTNEVDAEIINKLSFKNKDNFIFLVDYCNIDTQKTKTHIQNIDFRISYRLKKLKYLSWFDGNQEKVAAAEDFMTRKKQMNFTKFNDADDVKMHFYLELCGENKHFGIVSEAEQELNFQKIRSLFNNRKSREKTTHKQFNFSLSRAADKNINKLAQENMLNRSQVVDIFFRDMKNFNVFSASITSSNDLKNHADETVVLAKELAPLVNKELDKSCNKNQQENINFINQSQGIYFED